MAADEDFRCASSDFVNNLSNEENFPTHSSSEQIKVEQSCKKLYDAFKNRLEVDINIPKLQRDRHEAFLQQGIKNLSQSYECLDASRPWLCYWILHSMELLDILLDEDATSKIAQFLNKCQCPEGGFAGGPGQDGHLAPTYAAVNALCIIGTEEAYKVIDRETLYSFLMKRRTSEGAYTMHDGGEVDIRGAYCAASVARLTNMVTTELFKGTGEWIISCQTYEGGFAGAPGLEAHGGYSFCGLAALILLGKEKLCNIKDLLRWTVNRQMRYEGGFQGRTNKLVDGCYSFWQGGAFPLLHMTLSMDEDDCLSAERWMFNQGALQEYLLVCCQYPSGGLIDKPGKPRDFYHTCYCLSGLSVAQHFAGGKLSNQFVIGHKHNDLKLTHPVFNIGIDCVMNAGQYFNKLPLPSQ